ncbi:MAG: hypothetical protein O3A87_05190 [Verrucomicrobia bacterium]|nr:hypothetical protein [Verrucomicrobiota bacterium]MDA1005861.1 hypothetical protein [Verrucomicrobiota bacterium]
MGSMDGDKSKVEAQGLLARMKCPPWRTLVLLFGLLGVIGLAYPDFRNWDRKSTIFGL